MTWSSKRRIAGFLVCVAGMGAAGCGSSHSSNVSQAAFEAGANSVCAKFNGQERSLGQPEDTNLQSVSSYLDKVASIGQDEINQLKTLGTPKSDQSKLSVIYASMQVQVAQARQLARTVEAGNLASASSQLQRLQSATGPINQQFDSLGLNTCGSGS